MPNDLRDRNQYFQKTSIGGYAKEYAGAISHGLNRVDEESLERAMILLSGSHGRIFALGNGGSWSISDHLCCDFSKGTSIPNKIGLHPQMPAPSLYTALTNDVGQDLAFEEYLKLYLCNHEDLCILISSSGNSSNIVKAAEYCMANACAVIGMTGFDGGALRRLSNVSLHIPFNNYGVVEDCHQALMHILAQFYFLSHK